MVEILCGICVGVRGVGGGVGRWGQGMVDEVGRVGGWW